MRIRFLAVAQIEFDEAIEYYNTEQVGLGDEFLIRLFRALKELDFIQKPGVHSV